MTAMEALIIFSLGIAAGYQLPALLARWRRIYRRKTFKPVLVRPYMPDSTDRRSE